MALYLKKIRNVAELEKEKKRLIREKKQLEKEGVFSIKSLLGAKDEAGAKGGKQSFVESALPGIRAMSGPLLSLVIGIVQSRLLSGKGGVVKTAAAAVAGGALKKGGKLLGATTRELVGGYLKWKAAELSYKGVTLIIKKRKKNKEAREAKAEERTVKEQQAPVK